MQKFLTDLLLDWPWNLLAIVPLLAILYTYLPAGTLTAPGRWFGRLATDEKSPKEVADGFLDYFTAERARIATARTKLANEEKALDEQQARVLKGGAA